MHINFKRKKKKNQHETTESQGRIGFAKVYEKWTWEAIESKILTVHRKEPCFANEKKKTRKLRILTKVYMVLIAEGSQVFFHLQKSCPIYNVHMTIFWCLR